MTTSEFNAKLNPIIDDIAGLRATSSPTIADPNTRYVDHHTVAGDGGGGMFVWDANSLEADDEGIYILPTGHVGSGRWIREGHLGNEYNALWWGMGSVIDTDATALFQKAIDSSLGKVLRVPRNPLATVLDRYKLANVVPRSDMHIKADPDAMFYAVFASGTYQPCWVVDLDDNPTEFSIEGGTWDRFKPFFFQDQPVSLPAMAHGQFKNLSVRGGTGDEDGFVLCLYVDLYFHKVHFSNLNYGVHLYSVHPYSDPEVDSTATGGTTTTLIDTALSGTSDDQYNTKQIVLRPYTATCEVRTVTDYDSGTQTFTVSPAFATGPSASDVYYVYDEKYEVIDAIDAGSSTTTVIALKDVDLTDDEHNGKQLYIQDSSSVNYLKTISDTDGTAETITLDTPLAGAPSVGSFALVVPSNGYSGHQNITNFDQCRWHAMENYGIYKPDNDRDAAVLRVHNCSAEVGEKGWMKVGGVMETLVVEGMYIEYNGQTTDEPDIIIDASAYTIRGCTLRDLYFSVQSSIQTEKLHIIGRVNPTVENCMFNLATSGPPTAAIYLDLWQTAHRQTGAYLRNNLILDGYNASYNYRDRLYRIEPGMNEAAIVVEECGLSNQDLMPGLEISLGTVTANDVEVTLYKAVTADYGSPETINTFSDGVLGQVLHIRFTTANTTIAHEAGGAGQIHLKGGVDLTPAVDSIMTLYHNGTDWYEEISPSLVVAHATDHITGGTDEIDGDQLDIDFTPTNYTPSTVPAEATNVDHLTAHLAGLDNALGASGGSVSGTAQTTSAAAVVIYTFSTTTDQCLLINGMVQGRNNASGDVAYFKFNGFFDNNAGVVTLKADDTIVSQKDVAAWGYDFNISGTDVQVRVEGSAAATVEWLFNGESFSHG